MIELLSLDSVFFFQAEDGIRDADVTGVQTCALPILQLAKLGITNITVWDFDVVEEHNVPNQLFGLNDIGKPKVEALKQIVAEHTGTEINIKNEKFTRG